MAEFNISQLQNYIKEKRAQYIELTQCGYDIWFYSRFNVSSDIIGNIATNPTNPTVTNGSSNIKYMGCNGLTHNVYLTSNVNRNSDVTCVTSIQVRNTITETGGSTAQLEIINPDNINYFLPTIGSYGKGKNSETGSNTNSQTDYDYSEKKSIDQQRIGLMDTVLIRLKNTKTSPSTDPTCDSETVFRGCIKGIHRSTSAGSGNSMIIRLGDFSEYMRMISAIPLGGFQTISLAITGRGLVDSLVKYTNYLYTGTWQFLGTNMVQNFVSSAVKGILGTPVPGPTSGGGNTFTNRTWVALVLSYLNVPPTQNNIDNYTHWMAAEEPASNWFEYSSKYQTYRNNPQNNSLGTTEKLPDGTGSYPNLTIAAYYAAKNLVEGLPVWGYGAIISALKSNASSEMFCEACARSSWSEARYGIAAAGAPAQYLIPGRTFSYFSQISAPEVTAPAVCGTTTGTVSGGGNTVQLTPAQQSAHYDTATGIPIAVSAPGITPAQQIQQSGIATQHAMAVPPFMFLEGSSLTADVISTNTAAGQIAAQQATAARTTNNNDTTGDNSDNSITGFIGQIISKGKGAVTSFIQDNNVFKPAIPEDTETINYYQAALNKYNNDPNINQHTNILDTISSGMQEFQKYAWLLSDLYIEAGAASFEHQKVWNVADNTAKRSMREVYFDFAPKLSPYASFPYQTALVSEIKKATQQKIVLNDIHPNIGILKYRLSPCIRAYQEGNDTSQIWQWSVSDNEIIKFDTTEADDSVYTAVFGFGSALDAVTIAQDITEIAMGQNRGLLVFAHSIDAQIERRIGYRFMTESDMNVNVNILMYFISYILLLESEMNMFSSQITVLGNPKYKPGSLVRLEGRNIDYYCTDVIHNWAMTEGYTTSLILNYGHTSGIMPAALTGGQISDDITANAICANRSNALEKYAPKSKFIGGVNLQCIIYTLWQFMTCFASTPELLKAAMPESQKSGITIPPIIATTAATAATAGLTTTSSFIPGVCTKPAPGLQQWPYKIYGPLGIRLDAYKTYNSNISDTDAKKILTADFGKAMTTSVSYITSLLNKYSEISKPLPNAGTMGTPGVYINGKDTFEKIIAAWYSNENILSMNSNDTDKLSTIIKGLKTIYFSCLQCTGVYGNPTTTFSLPIPGTNSNISILIWKATQAFKISHAAPNSDRNLIGAAYRNECVASVEAILATAGIAPIGGYGTNNVDVFCNALQARGWSKVSQRLAVPGDFVTVGNQDHIGIYEGNGMMISNSSTPGSFTWEDTVAAVQATHSSGQAEFWHHS